MSRIRSKDTRPEIVVRKFLHNHGIRYRLNCKSLVGKPDLKLTKYRTVVFVNGCFWHGHSNCGNFKFPESNKYFWRNKILDTKMRDKRVIRELKDSNWKVFVIWECQLKGAPRVQNLHKLKDNIIKGDSTQWEYE